MKINVATISFLVLLSGCDKPASKSSEVKVEKKEKSTELSEFINKVKSDLVYIKGGEFQMGDFGIEHYKEHLALDANPDSKPLHKVEITTFSISKFKTSNEDYQFYLKQIAVEMRKAGNSLSQTDWDSLNRLKNMPAHGDWYDADKYCSWLAKVTNIPFSLPTEAQWEYAARSRGQYLVVPTNDGTWKVENGKGINISTDQTREEWAENNQISLSSLTAMPVDNYPPNPLGIYDMAGNGFEWVKDWYDPEYYEYSPVKDPQGPEKPTYINPYGKYSKVMRAVDLSGPGRGISIVRHSQTPDNNGRLPLSNTFRCVVNSSSPIK